MAVGAGAIGVILWSGSSTVGWTPSWGSDPVPAPVQFRAAPEIKPLPDAPNAAGRAPVAEFDPPPPPPEPGTWEAVRLAPRVAALGAMGGVVAEDLANLQERITPCFGEETESRFGRVPVSRSARQQPENREGPTLLVLQLETRPGQIRIQDAPLVAQGSAGEGTIACAQQILRGHVIEAEGLTTTGQARLVFNLVP